MCLVIACSICAGSSRTDTECKDKSFAGIYKCEVTELKPRRLDRTIVMYLTSTSIILMPRQKMHILTPQRSIVET